LKVLHILNSAGGGAALSTLGLMNQLRIHGVDSIAICHDNGSAAERDALDRATNGRVLFTPLYWWNKKIRAPTWKRPLIELRQLMRTGLMRKSTNVVVQFARQHKTDLIHSNTILTLEGGRASRQLNLPHVWHLRELVGPNRPFQFSINQKRFGEFIGSNCEALIANSNVTASLVRDIVRPGLLHVIPNGIDLERFVGIRGEGCKRPIIVAMVANLSSRVKNHQMFVHAASLVQHSPTVQFRIYGIDPSNDGRNHRDRYASHIHQLVAATGQASRFHWPGFVEKPEKIMSEVDILVHPTGQESFGRIVVEAMAAQLPVVGVRSGGVGEIVMDGVTGWLVEPDDTRSMANKIEDLANNPQRRCSFGAAGRQRAESHYSLEVCAQRVFQVYQQLQQVKTDNDSLGRISRNSQ
jgi:glycosyltransferase involved in cell wall biosynthesis